RTLTTPPDLKELEANIEKIASEKKRGLQVRLM
ncbi:unnamed protein product, partial [marine sediment metagenome]